jgi:nucleoside-diphosphate-sugar epimerase
VAQTVKRRILLTGASGTLGRNFVEVVGSDPTLEILSVLREESRPCAKYASVQEVRTDLSNRRGVAGLVAEFAPHTIVHCAATGMEFPRTQWFDLIRFNVDFTVNLCESAAAAGGAHFIYVGTGLAYRPLKRPLSEGDALDTLHPYGASKAAADMLVRAAAAEFRLPLTVLRPFSFTGLGDDRSRLFPSLLRAAVERRCLKLTSGSQIRDHISARDVAEAIVAAIGKAPSCDEPHIFNVGGGCMESVRQMVESVIAELEVPLDLEFGAKSPGKFEPACLVADYSKAADQLGWRPRHRLVHAVWELAGESFPELTLREPAADIG